VDHGKFPVKRTTGEPVHVKADIFADGHDVIAALLLYRTNGAEQWQQQTMKFVENDVFAASFIVQQQGAYEFVVEAWIDRYESWRQDILKKQRAGMEIKSELLEGAALLQTVAKQAEKSDATALLKAASEFQKGDTTAIAGSALSELLARYPDRSAVTRSDKAFEVLVEPERARFGAWYELFPRSCTSSSDAHGTLRDCEQRLTYIASMGFDVVYLPPIHPIGKTFRKGPNNTLNAAPRDPGSPWAIGSEEGGHKSVHPELGTLKDFDHFVAKVRGHGMEVALDLAYQCSPDHPYVRENPQWFKHRPDGSIKYAENPPKKYQDIYPLDFECEDWRNLWEELKDIVLFWIDHGIRIFRVDNPHTKPFRFWQWMIETVREQHPDIIFLSEAFTRPKVMQYLAKIGFSQSYTYFTWRNTKTELVEYLTELTQTNIREYLRPNFFVNTPDILHEYLQFGGPPAFQIRLILAATLSASYGLYGPAFELCEGRAISGTEEYLDSEKYQIRHWNLDAPVSIKALISRVNQIRSENVALQFNENLMFHPSDNEQLLCYSKSTEDLSNIIVVVVNLDPHHVQSGWVKLPLANFKLQERQNYQVHDLLTDARYLWHGEVNYVELNPKTNPAHVFRLRRKVKTEHDFDYFL
jgi:starch synthase (maltosyl-transferring)